MADKAEDEIAAKLRSIKHSTSANRVISYVYVGVFLSSIVAALWEYMAMPPEIWGLGFTVTFVVLLVSAFMVVALQRQLAVKRAVTRELMLKYLETKERGHE